VETTDRFDPRPHRRPRGTSPGQSTTAAVYRRIPSRAAWVAYRELVGGYRETTLRQTGRGPELRPGRRGLRADGPGWIFAQPPVAPAPPPRPGRPIGRGTDVIDSGRRIVPPGRAALLIAGTPPRLRGGARSRSGSATAHTRTKQLPSPAVHAAPRGTRGRRPSAADSAGPEVTRTRRPGRRGASRSHHLFHPAVGPVRARH